MRATIQRFAQNVTEKADSRLNARSAKVPARGRQTAPPAQSVAARARFDHWWNNAEFRALKSAGLTPDDAKVAMVYEATRRRPEVAGAAAANVIPREWQRFTGLCVAWQANTWADLHSDQRAQVHDAFCDPTYLPPIGLSVFPRDCQQAERSSLIVLDLPCPGNEAAWVFHMEQLQAAGFTLAAIDTKATGAIKTAGVALLKRPRTCRQADILATVTTGERDIPNGVRLAATADVTLPPRIRFSFERICRELERFDADATPSDFMIRVRL